MNGAVTDVLVIGLLLAGLFVCVLAFAFGGAVLIHILVAVTELGWQFGGWIA